MYATLILDTDTHGTELSIHPDLADAMAAIEAAASWLHPTQTLRLLHGDADGHQWTTRGELCSYYGTDERAGRIRLAARLGKVHRSYPSSGSRHLGERGFTFTGDADLAAELVA